MRISAPYPNVSTIIFIPQPILSNTVQLQDERDYKYMMDKSMYSYINRIAERKYVFTFNLTLQKMFEVKQFIEQFIADQWEIKDHHDNLLVGYCLTNPTTLTTDRRAHRDNNIKVLNYTLGENVTFELEFEAV